MLIVLDAGNKCVCDSSAIVVAVKGIRSAMHNIAAIITFIIFIPGHTSFHYFLLFVVLLIFVPPCALIVALCIVIVNYVNEWVISRWVYLVLAYG